MINYLNINNKNILTIGFISAFSFNSFTEYYIIIARKNEINNLYSFSNPCYLANLIMNDLDSEEICFKRVYLLNKYLIFEDIDIKKKKKMKMMNTLLI